MQKFVKIIFMGVLFAGAPLLLTACEEQTPAEEAVEEIEEGMDDVGDAVEESAEEVKDELDDATTN